MSTTIRHCTLAFPVPIGAILLFIILGMFLGHRLRLGSFSQDRDSGHDRGTTTTKASPSPVLPGQEPKGTAHGTEELDEVYGDAISYGIHSSAENWNRALIEIPLDAQEYHIHRVDECYSSEDHYSLQILKGYGLEHDPRSYFLWEYSTDKLFALCKDGVYSFDIGFEWGCLISDTIDGAIQYILNPGTRAKGPARWAGDRYNPQGEDVFGDKFGEVVYDSGIEDCDSEDCESEYGGNI